MIEVVVMTVLAAGGWTHYGGDEGGQRFVSATQINRDNVRSLKRVWHFRTGDLDTKAGDPIRNSSFEATPILIRDQLVLCTPFNRVVALDPGTGQPLWEYDAKIDLTQNPANDFICRGVSYWEDRDRRDAFCGSRIFMGTNDARLIALDAVTGKRCPDFGAGGEVHVEVGMDLLWPGEYQITSAPAIVGDVVVTGSAISDNQRVDAPKGTVRAFDVRSGELRWAFDPVADGPAESWLNASEERPGHANVWSTMSVDNARDLIFLPTSSPSPDFFGGLRPGDNRYANSIVALKGTTGEVVWHFQTVHHDLWDYDVAAQPNLVELKVEGADRPVPALIAPMKTGLVFTLHRETGQPLHPVEERPVPTDVVAGEWVSPTQPFPVRPPPLVPTRISPEEAWGLTPWDRGWCRQRIEEAAADGLFTPPTLRGTVLYPFTGGGVNWGSAAWDPQRQWLVVNLNRLIHRVSVVPRDQMEALRAGHFDGEVGPQTGTPYGMTRNILLSPLGLPCNPPPWGTLVAVDMARGEIVWEVPLGTTEELAPLVSFAWGVPALGGPFITATGLVFIAGTTDHYLRAFDIETGTELWEAKLPAGGQATPMSYVWKGRQYVVVAAGGHGQGNVKRGDSVVAFALPAD